MNLLWEPRRMLDCDVFLRWWSLIYIKKIKTFLNFFLKVYIGLSNSSECFSPANFSFCGASGE